MAPDEESKVTANEWLLRARSSLAMAKAPKPPQAIWEELCFHSQQAAEKAVKAVLVFYQIDFPRTHDITELLVLLRHFGNTIPSEILEAGDLTTFAVVTRYPGFSRPVNEHECRQAVQLAERVVQWAGRVLSSDD